MSVADLHHSLELAAERGGDIYPAIYDAYFERCAGSRDLMQLTDIHMRGRMLDSLFELLLADDVAEQFAYLRFETKNHASWGVQPHMYENLLAAVRDTVRNACGETGRPRWQNSGTRTSASWSRRSALARTHGVILAATPPNWDCAIMRALFRGSACLVVCCSSEPASSAPVVSHPSSPTRSSSAS